MTDDDTLPLLGNKYNPEILSATGEPKSAQELSEDLGIPIATCYRRINELEEAGFLELKDRPLSDQQRRTKRYRRNIEEVTVDFRGGLSVEVVKQSDAKSRLDDIWRNLSSGDD